MGRGGLVVFNETRDLVSFIFFFPLGFLVCFLSAASCQKGASGPMTIMVARRKARSLKRSERPVRQRGFNARRPMWCAPLHFLHITPAHHIKDVCVERYSLIKSNYTCNTRSAVVPLEPTHRHVHL